MCSTNYSNSAISGLLTVIITTSPTPSAPSTELISSVLQSFEDYGHSLLSSRVIVVFDTYEHIVPKERLKKGQVTAEGAANFSQYKENVKHLIFDAYGCHNGDDDGAYDGCHTTFTTRQDEAEYGWTLRGDFHGEEAEALNSIPVAITQTLDKRVTFIEPTERVGFGLAVRSALRVTETPYVWVQQHDWVLAADIPVGKLLGVMEASNSPSSQLVRPESELTESKAQTAPVKYISFVSIRMLSYAISDHVTRYPALRSLTGTLKRDIPVLRSSSLDPTATSQDLGGSVSTSVPLTPLFFWFDKPHLASTAHYLARVFPSRLALGRGDFIEDKIGNRARDQMKAGSWEKWATWLYYPDEGRKLCLRHLQGRTWAGEGAEEKKREKWRALNRLEGGGDRGNGALE